MKFDAAKLNERHTLDVPALLRQLGVPDDAPILLGGSTHDGEEVILAEVARRLRQQFPKLFLVLVPRHFERCREIVLHEMQAVYPFEPPLEAEAGVGPNWAEAK